MKHRIYLLFVVMFVVISCDRNDSDTSADGFNRAALLESWADNIIIPSYELYVAEVNTLVSASGNFTENPTEQNLEEVRTAWLNAYKVWQNVSIYEIGKAETTRMRDYTNSYPLNEEKVNTNISSGSYNFSLSTQLSAQGFPAVDYLLNGLGTSDSEIIAFYTSHQNKVNYKQYLTDVTARLQSMGEEVLTDWKSTYRVTFISKEGSSATESLDKLVNDYIFHIEKLVRKAKIGDPIDFFGDPVVIRPERVEAFYKKDVSKELLMAAVVASQNLFNGKYLNSETEGASLKSYLKELHVEAGGQGLEVIIDERYNTAITKIELLDANFYEGIQSDRNKYVEVRKALHNVIDILKTNMISEIRVKADFNDSDGD